MAVRAPTFGHPAYGLTWEHPLLRASAGSGLVPSFVPSGNVPPHGLSQCEHFSWAHMQGYPVDDVLAQVIRRLGAQSIPSLPMTLQTLRRSDVPG